MTHTDINRQNQSLLLDSKTRKNPYPVYASMREHSPIAWHDTLNSWFLTSYEDVRQVLAHPEMSVVRSMDNAKLSELSLQSQGQLVEIVQFLSLSIVLMDPPDHRRQRVLLNHGFKPKFVNSLQDTISEIATGLFDKVAEKGSCEVISDFAYPLPAMVLADMFGMPKSDWSLLFPWSKHIIAFIQGTLTEVVVSNMYQTMAEMKSYLTDLINERRKKPQADMISALITARQQQDMLSDEELLSACILLLFGGHHSTMNLIANATLSLLRNPDQLMRLRNDRSLMPSAIEEFLRYESPIQMTVRRAKSDLMIGNTHIKENQELFVCLGAANWDPKVFENPEQLDLGRKPNHHVAFGHRTHYCLGAPLAKLSTQTALNLMLDRFPDWHYDETNVSWRDEFIVRSLDSMYLSF